MKHDAAVLARHSVSRLLRLRYRSFDCLVDLAHCLLDTIIGVTDASSAQLTLANHQLVAGEPQTHFSVGTASGHEICHIPLLYHGRRIGNLLVCSNRRTQGRESLQSMSDAIASLTASHIARFSISRAITTRFGRDLHLVGTSDALFDVDSFVERASASSEPILLVCAPGLREYRVAAAVHHAGRQALGDMMDLDCRVTTGSDLRQQLTLFCGGRTSGTVLFRSIQYLDVQWQQWLVEFMEGCQTPGSGIRFIASAGPTPDQVYDGRLLSPTLLLCFDHLNLYIEPLRKRREDIPPLVYRYLRKYSARDTEFSPDALAVLQNYDWPENVSELERVVARSAASCSDTSIGVATLNRYAPRLVGPRMVAVSKTGPDRVELPSGSSDAFLNLIRSLVDADSAQHGCVLHASLQRALAYLCAHASEPLCMKGLSQSAFVSASHLAHLFRTEVGLTFKHILALVRIEKAKVLLVTRPDLSLLDVGQQAGFGEVRTFQRTFKRHVGCSPASFRRVAVGDRSRPPGALSSRLSVERWPRSGAVHEDSLDLPMTVPSGTNVWPNGCIQPEAGVADIHIAGDIRATTTPRY